MVKTLLPDKVPAPDGFTGQFFTTCWGIIKDDFMRAIEIFSSVDTRGFGTINKALVSLLP